MEFLERVRWTSGTPDTRINFYYEHQRSGADMQYRVKVVVEPITGASYYGYTIVAVVSMDGSQKVEQTLKNNNPPQWSSNIEWTSPWYTINNKVSGTTSLAIRMKSNSGRDVTYNYSMTVDPAYTSVTKWTVTSYTETEATISWQTSDVCNHIRYGKSESSYSTLDVNSNSGSVTISGLSVGAANTLYFMPCRKDSNLWGNGGDNLWKTTSVTTFNYPYVNTNTLPSFTIGQNPTINLYNPKNRSCTIYLIGNDNSTIYTGIRTTNGDTILYPDASERTAMYQSIPSSRTGNYKVRLVCSELSRDTTIDGKTYSVVGDEIPTFEDFNYFDDNETTADLTGDRSKVINGYSTVTVVVHNDQKAEANYYATMDKYEFQVGNSEKKEFPYTNLETSESITNVPNGAITVWAIDSRSLSKSVTKNAEEIPYVNIQKNAITVSRLNNIGEAVTLNYNGTFWNGDFGAENNAIVEAKYRYKKTNESWPEPAVWNGTTTITPTTTQGSNDFSFTGDIVGDIVGVGFDEQYSYNIEVMISDKLSSTLFQVTLGSGRPNIAVDANGVAINGKYDDSLDNGLQVTGKIYLNGSEIGGGGVDIPQQPNPPSNPQTDDLWIDTDEAGYQITIDNTVSTSSTNPVQNQAITNYVKPYIDDTGWVDLSSYVNTSNFGIRSDSPQFKPMARRIGKVVFWRGSIYCHTRIQGEQGVILRNLPSQFMPSREVDGGGKHYGMQKAFSIWTEGNEIHVNDDSTIETTNFWQGYSLSCLGPYTID